MPPRKSARAAAAAAAAPPAQPLKDCLVVVAGTFPKGVTQGSISTLIARLGGATHSSVTKGVTHVITTQTYFDAEGAKLQPALGRSDVKIVSYDWLLQCEKDGARAKEDDFVFKPVTNGAPMAKGKKRAAPEDDEEDEEEEEEKPSSKKRTKRAASTKSDDAADTKPASKTKGKATAKAAPKAAPKTAAKGKKAAAKADDEDEEDAEDTKPDVKPDTKAVAKDTKGKKADKKAQTKVLNIPVDEHFPHDGYQVYIDPQGVPFDASLNQTNASNNNNKFYRVQLLYNSKGDHKTWTRWGRVGETGQSALLGSGTLDDAIKNYSKKFKDKSGLTWDNRNDKAKPGKYTFIERSYEDSDDEDDKDEAEVDDDEEDEEDDDYKPPESKLDPELQSLMGLIFNLKFMQATMADLNYDANKLPLGKLAKSTILKGFQALKDLAALFDDQSLAQKEYNMAYGAAVEHLSNQFYSVIPHAFGRNRPPVISTEQMLKKEIDLLDSLGDMKEAAAIMKKERAGKKNQQTEHEYDRQFAALNMQEMTPLDPKSAEFTNIEEYLLGTKGATHHMKFALESVFRIERNGEFERFEKSEYASVPSDRRLLWHGSRCTNFGGILSQGLRIAPPEAPVSGYMFGKGIYLADMASKSANYCCSHLSERTGLLLLCEAELGDPMQELTNASYNAGDDAKAKGLHSTWGQGRVGPSEWKDAGCIHPSLEGVKMPDVVAAKPGDTNIKDAYLQYNEYITYDVDQVRLRYLLRVRMN